jgi:hypothetical protein
MRRALPFEEDDLNALLDWCNASEQRSMYTVPVGHVTRALQRFLGSHEASDALRERVAQFATRVRGSYDKDVKRHGTALEQLLAGSATAPDSADGAEPNGDAPRAVLPPPPAAPAGDPAVLHVLKRHLGVAQAEVGTEALDPEGFPLRIDTPFRLEHSLLSEMLASVIGTRNYSQPTLETLHGADRVLRMDPEATGRLLLAAAERDAAGFLVRGDNANPAVWQARYAVASLTKTLAQRAFALDRDGVFDFLLYVAMRAPAWDRRALEQAFVLLLDQVER